MHRIDTDGAVSSQPTPPPEGALVGYFSDGDALTGTPGTVISAAWLNAVQEEISNVILEAGLSLDKAATDQLKQAIISIIAANALSGSVGSTADRIVTTNADGTVGASSNAAIDSSDNLGGVSSVAVGAGTSSMDPSAILDVQSTDRGVLLPRMSEVERDAIVAPASSLVVFNTDEKRFQYYADATWKNVTPRTQVTFEVTGPFYVNGAPQVGLLHERAKQSRRLLSANLFLRQNGIDGALTVDVQASLDSGQTWSSIFATKPTVFASAGNFASSSNAVLNDSSTVYPAGAIFRLDVETIPDGVPNDFVLTFESEAL